MGNQIEQPDITSRIFNIGSPGRLSRIEIKVRNDIYRVYYSICIPFLKYKACVTTAERYKLSSALVNSKEKGLSLLKFHRRAFSLRLIDRLSFQHF